DLQMEKVASMGSNNGKTQRRPSTLLEGELKARRGPGRYGDTHRWRAQTVSDLDH
ncbi:unnamed protein product, partial [Sphenostylis stenocarpa]